MKTIFHISTTAEPGEYHTGDPTSPDFQAVFAAVEVQRDDSADTDAGARALFDTGLDWIRSGYYLPLTLEFDGVSWGVAVGSAVTRLFQGLQSDPPFELGTWLDTRKADLGTADFFLTSASEQTADLGRMTAFDILRAAVGWTAPIPQYLGLVDLLDNVTVPTFPNPATPGANPTYKVVILVNATTLPSQIANMTATADDDANPTLFTINADLAGVPCTWICDPLQTSAAPDGRDWTASKFRKNGTLNHSDEGEAFWRLQTILRAQGPSALATLPRLLDLIEDSDLQKTFTDADRLAVFRAGLVSSLDSIVAGLVLPLSNAVPGGQHPRLLVLLLEFLLEGATLTARQREDLFANLRNDLQDHIKSRNIIGTLTAAFKDIPWFTDGVTAFNKAQPEGDMPRIAEFLNRTATYIQTEEGTEKFVLALLADFFTTHPAYRDASPDFAKGWRGFSDLLNGPFNTAEALRSDLGRDMAATVMTQSPDLDTAKARLRGADWYLQRFDPTYAPTNANIFGPLRLIAAELPPACLAKLTPVWGDVIGTVLAPLDGGKFRPEAAPMPMPIRMFDDPDPQMIAKAAENISGFGFVVAGSRNSVPSEADHVHASLISVEVKDQTMINVVLPTFPALSNGSGEMFIPYTGMPFATPNRPQSRHDQQSDQWEAPYKTDDATYVGPVHPTPELTYGCFYGGKPFWIANSGALPHGLRDGSPFDPAQPTGDFAGITGSPNLRRTPISQTILVGSTTRSKGLERIGHIPESVFPLALDLPRPPEVTQNQNPPILLLAPEGREWSKALTEPVTARLSLPGVSFADFEAWCSKPTPIAGAANVPNYDLLKVLRRAKAVLEANSSALADKLNALPDPAVESLLIELVPYAAIDGDVATRPKPVQVSLTPYSASKLNRLFAGKTDTFANLLATQDLLDPKELLPLYATLIESIFDAAQCEMTFQSKAGGAELSKNLAILPPGNVALLRVRPLVATSHFQASVYFDPDMVDPAKLDKPVPVYDGKYVFDGADLTLEAMKALPQEMVAPTAIDVVYDGRARRYSLDLQTLGTDTKLPLSYFGEVDIATQFWRVTGRPIYSWIDPVQKRQAGTTGPIVPLAPQNDVWAFEAEAFVNRDKDDAEFRRHRLPVLDANAPRHSLTRHEWPDLSASYARHRFQFRSRYAGALVAAADIVRDMPRAAEDDWDKRAAILAEMQRADLTRPQLRAFMPLQGRIARDEAPLSPPILAVLNEPPMGQLGLAERVTAEVKSVRHFMVRDQKLGLHSLRKEVGPDPRLRYYGLDDDRSRQVLLRTEGPVGLHFESASTADPRFVNTQFLLHVRSPATLPDLEESFAAVLLRRHADPGWQWHPTDLGAADRWFDLPTAPATLDFVDGNSAETVIRVVNEQGRMTIQVSRNALYATDPTAGNASGAAALVPVGPAPWIPIELASADHDQGRIRLCLRSLGPTTAELIAYAGGVGRETRDLATGSGYDCLASVTLTTKGQITAPDGLVATAAWMSEPTFVEWARTGRDLDHYHVAAKDGGLIQPHSTLSDLRLHQSLPATGSGIAKKVLHFRPKFDTTPLQVTSPVSARPYPLHLHRHLAFILRKPAETLGREVPLFSRAFLADFNGMAAIDAVAETSAVLAEFEVPAKILWAPAGGNISDSSAHLAPFTRVRFQLSSSLSPDDLSPLAFRFHLRCVNRSLLKGEVVKLTLGAVSLTLTMSQETRGLILEVVPGKASTAWLQGPDGLVEIKGVATVPADALSRTQIDMSASVAQQDLWADISLLHRRSGDGPAQPHPAIDFDWFFGPVTTEATLTEAVAPSSLNALREVQARLIGLSQPVDLMP